MATLEPSPWVFVFNVRKVLVPGSVFQLARFRPHSPVDVPLQAPREQRREIAGRDIGTEGYAEPPPDLLQ